MAPPSLQGASVVAVCNPSCSNRVRVVGEPYSCLLVCVCVYPLWMRVPLARKWHHCFQQMLDGQPCCLCYTNFLSVRGLCAATVTSTSVDAVVASASGYMYTCSLATALQVLEIMCGNGNGIMCSNQLQATASPSWQYCCLLCHPMPQLTGRQRLGFETLSAAWRSAHGWMNPGI